MVCRGVSLGFTPARVHALPRGSRHLYDTPRLSCVASTESAVTDKRCDSYSVRGRPIPCAREAYTSSSSSNSIRINSDPYLKYVPKL